VAFSFAYNLHTKRFIIIFFIFFQNAPFLLPFCVFQML